MMCVFNVYLISYWTTYVTQLTGMCSNPSTSGCFLSIVDWGRGGGGGLCKNSVDTITATTSTASAPVFEVCQS